MMGCKFSNLLKWSHEINELVLRYRKQYGHYPNILVASRATLSRMDVVANSKLNEPAEKFIKLSGFKGNDYSLKFCVEDSLKLDTIRLVYHKEQDES